MESSSPTSARRVGTRHVLLAGIAGLVGGCGPSTDQLAATALASAPISYFAALFAVWGLHGLWREHIGDVHPRWTLAGVYALGLTAVAGITAGQETIEGDVFAISAFMLAVTCAALSMLVGRLGLRRAREQHDYGLTVVLAPALVSALLYAPFLLAWLERGDVEELAFSVGLAMVGIGGTYVAGPLILGLVVETVVARGREDAPARRSS